MVDIVEDEGGGLVDRRGPRAGGRIGLGAGMNGQRLEARIAFVVMVVSLECVQRSCRSGWNNRNRLQRPLGPGLQAESLDAALPCALGRFDDSVRN